MAPARGFDPGPGEVDEMSATTDSITGKEGFCLNCGSHNLRCRGEGICGKCPPPAEGSSPGAIAEYEEWVANRLTDRR